jgi:stage III sporulation protein AB
MVKYIGIALIVIAGVGMGLYYARRLYRRAEWLRRCERLLDALSDRLTYTAAPLATLWLSLADNDATAAYPLVEDAAAALRGGSSFAAALGDALDKAATQGLIQPPEQALMREVCATLGRSDRAHQRESIAHFREQLADVRRAAERQVGTRAQVYQMLGVAGGVSLALLLL